MKQSAIKVGKKHMLSLGRRGAVSVEVVKLSWPGSRVGTSRSPQTWLLRDSTGAYHVDSARRLSPCPVTDRDGNLIGYAHEM